MTWRHPRVPEAHHTDHPHGRRRRHPGRALRTGGQHRLRHQRRGDDHRINGGALRQVLAPAGAHGPPPLRASHSRRTSSSERGETFDGLTALLARPPVPGRDEGPPEPDLCQPGSGASWRRVRRGHPRRHAAGRRARHGGGAGCPHNLGHPQPTRVGDARLVRR